MKILFLAHLFPLPLDSGGKIKSYYTIKNLASKHEVFVLAYTRTDDEIENLEMLRSICSEIKTVPLARSALRQVFDLAKSLVMGTSFIVSRDFRKDMQSAYDAIIKDFMPDVVHIDHLQMAQFVDFTGGYKTVLDNHNVESLIIRRIAQTPGSMAKRLYASIEWRKLRDYELKTCMNSDMVLTVSEEDKAALLQMQPKIKRIEAVPIGVDVGYFDSAVRDNASSNILSIATMYWPPNVDSMHYFVDEIYPLVKKEYPQCTLTIAGQRPVASIQSLASDSSIKVTGYVSDSREVARDCGVFIVPLRSGSGVRVKLLNAFAMGLPVVSTSIGAEGLDVRSGEHLILADTPQEFAAGVLKLLTDREYAAQIGMNAKKLVQQHYSWEKIGTRLNDIYDEFAD